MFKFGSYMSAKQLITSLEIKSLLQELGYPVMDCGDYLKTKALFRDGSDINSLTIYWKDNTCIDHVIGEVFDIQELIKRSLHFDSIEKSEEWLKTKKFVLPEFKLTEPVIKQIKKFNESIFQYILPDYSYWEKRHIDTNILKKTRGGLILSECKMKNRWVFPIFNSKNQLIALNGRSVINKNPKWKFLGQKREVVYPAFLNKKIIIDKKEVYLVESIGDFLALETCGIDNSLVLFGIDISNAIINFLLKISPNKIYIALNNDINSSNAGNNGSEKVKKRLLKYFDYKAIKIKLPPNDIKDWNDFLIKKDKKQLFSYITSNN